MGQGGVPTSRGGPIRRRREKRQLEHLAASTSRNGTPSASAAHVRLLGDEQPTPAGKTETHAAETADDDTVLPRTGGFHVHAVPIDQPVGD
jgi:hypothetical protein